MRFGCHGDILSRTFWACVGDETMKCALLFALVFHVPVTIVCLVRIRKFDAIIRIREDIRKLQGLRNTIRDIENTLAADELRQEFVHKLKTRLAPRIKKINGFRDIMAQPRFNTNTQADVVSHIKDLNRYLEYAENTLGLASEWLNLSNEERDTRVQLVTDWNLDAEQTDRVEGHT